MHETTHTPTCDGIHEIVDAKNVVARLDQLQHRVAADETRRARHQNFHSWKNAVKLWNPWKSQQKLWKIPDLQKRSLKNAGYFQNQGVLLEETNKNKAFAK